MPHPAEMFSWQPGTSPVRLRGTGGWVAGAVAAIFLLIALRGLRSAALKDGTAAGQASPVHLRDPHASHLRSKADGPFGDLAPSQEGFAATAPRSPEHEAPDPAADISSPDDVKMRREQVCSTLKAMIGIIDMALDEDIWYAAIAGTQLAIARDGDCILDFDGDFAVRADDVARVSAALEAHVAHRNLPVRVLRYGEGHPPPRAIGRPRGAGAPPQDVWYEGKGHGPTDPVHVPLRMVLLGLDGEVCDLPRIDIISRSQNQTRERCSLGDQPTFCLANAKAYLDARYGDNWASVVRPKPADEQVLASKSLSRYFDACHYQKPGPAVR